MDPWMSCARARTAEPPCAGREASGPARSAGRSTRRSAARLPFVARPGAGDKTRRMATEYPDLLLPDAAAWRAWLEQHHADSPGVRLILGRKGGTVTALDYAGALDEALCFGWIDG